MDKIRFATIGTSGICEDFLEVAKLHPDLEYTATYSRDEKKAGEFSAKHGSGMIFTDLDELANAEEVDAVYIASPNAFHFEQAWKMLNAGKHVFLEKPMCTNASQLERLFQEAEKQKVVLLEAMRPIHDIGFIDLQENLAQIGPIRKCYFQYSRYSGKYDAYKRGIRVNIFDPACSAGAVMDIGVYPIEFMTALFGRPKSVISESFVLQSGVDGATAAIAVYDGFYCVLDCSKISTSDVPCVIEGETGSIYLPYIRDVEKFKLKLRDGTVKEFQREECKNTFRYEVDAFVEMVKSGFGYEKYKEISRITMEILDEIRSRNHIVFPDDAK